jgi:5-formyltetrahydrofolate cyclo-ligase
VADTSDADAALDAAAAKAALRARLLGARDARPAAEREAAGAAFARHLSDWRAGCPGEPTVAAYLAVDGEPPVDAAIAALRAAGSRVLLPVVDGRDLNWALADDRLVRIGRYGLREPTGPRLGAHALAEADLVLVPALAVDRQGVRLGRGGGYYDRALTGWLAAGGRRDRLVAVIHDDELLDLLPREPHDVTVGAALTPGAFRRLDGG